MILNHAIFAATIEAAKAKAEDRTEILRAIDRAVIEIQKAKYWAFNGDMLRIQSTTPSTIYKIDDAHDCPALSKVCQHCIARLLLIRYTERLAPTSEVIEVDARAATIACIEAAWEGKGYTVGRALFRRFGVNQLSMLSDRTLNQITDAIKQERNHTMSEATSPQITTAPASTKLPHFTISFELNGFPIVAEAECKADALPTIIERLKALGATPPAKEAPASVAASNKPATIPTCPVHNAPMKASRKPGSYFCPKQIGDGAYCPEKS